jgi:hypothetical protein
MAQIEIVNPVAAKAKREARAAQRPNSLDAKTVGLFWNNKPGGLTALRRVAELLGGQFQGLQFRHYQGSAGSTTRYMTAADLHQIVAECDVVVGSTSDCGSCTSWLVNDLVRLENEGIPTVGLTARHFELDAKTTAKVVGLPGVPLAIVDAPFTNHTDDEIRAMVDGSIDQVIDGLLKPVTAATFTAEQVVETESFEGDDLLACMDIFNAEFIRRGWSDGLPLIPPTPRKLEAMLAATALDASAVIADGLYPGLGVATVAKIAVNGIMAGCSPALMPVLIALVNSYVGTGPMGKTQAMSTGPNAPLVMVSGPAVQGLGFNNGVCALGPGSVSHVNTVVGRALRLILTNIGHNYPGEMDMDTIGTANKYSFCVAENLERSPWEAWNVSKGFDADTSTVSIALVYPGPDVCDVSSSTPEGLLDTVASLTAHYRGTASIGRWLYGGRADPDTGKKILEKNIILVAPDHARLFEKHGWSRRDVGDYLYRVSRMPVEQICAQIIRDKKESLEKAHPEFVWLLDHPEMMAPTAEAPECYETFVVGGEQGRSQFLFGGSEVSTAAIDI